MAHLKKLSQVLNHFKPVQILPISIFGIRKLNFLEFEAIKHTTITKKMSQFEIPSVLKTAENSGLASLSANQTKLNSSFFFIHSDLKNDKWSGYSGSNYKVYINPSIIDESDELTQGFEECASFPFLFTQIERSRSILVEYMNLEGEYVEEELHDFHARVFQHEFDHLSGYLMTDFSVSFGRIHSHDPSKTPTLLKALDDNKQLISEAVQKVEKFASKTGTANKKLPNQKDRQFIERVVIDQEFEDDFRDAILTTCGEDYNKLV